MQRSAEMRQRSARMGTVRSRRNRRTALQRLQSRRNQAKILRGLSRNQLGFPNTIITKLRYATYVVLNAVGGSVANNIFSANSIYDPDITGTGHQPLYHDTYAGIYGKYTVLGSKIIVRYATGAGIPCQVGINKDDDATTTNNLETLMEQAGGVSAMAGALGAECIELVSTYSPLRDLGTDVKDDGASATAMGANPTDPFVYKVWAISADAATATSCVIQVIIDYTVKFTDLLTPVQS